MQTLPFDTGSGPARYRVLTGENDDTSNRGVPCVLGPTAPSRSSSTGVCNSTRAAAPAPAHFSTPSRPWPRTP